MPGNVPYQVGITGGIGSGKSVVARIFSMLDVPVYESDTEAKKLYFLPDVRKQVEQLLGADVYLSAFEIDRQAIAARMYASPTLREKLNAILHPAVGRHYASWLATQNHPYVLKVAALLFEANIYRSLDFNLLVVSPATLKIKRIQERDTFRSEDQIRRIMASQMEDAEKIPLANGIVHNDEVHSLIEQVARWNDLFMKKLVPPSSPSATPRYNDG